MPDDNELRIGTTVDVSQITSGTEQAAQAVSTNVSKMVNATLELKAATKEVDQIFKEYGSDVQLVSKLASDAIQRQVIASIQLTEAKKALRVEMLESVKDAQEFAESTNEATKAAEQLGTESSAATVKTAVGYRNARAAATGLFSELDTHGNRAMSSFLAQSESLGPILSAAFSGIAILGFIELAYRAGVAVYHWYQNVVLLKEAEEDLIQVEDRLTSAQRSAAEAKQHADDELFARFHTGTEIAQRELEQLKNKPFDLTDIIKSDKFQQLPEKIRRTFTDLHLEQIVPDQLAGKITEINERLIRLRETKEQLNKEAFESAAAGSAKTGDINMGDVDAAVIRAQHENQIQIDLGEALKKTLQDQDEARTSQLKNAEGAVTTALKKEADDRERDAVKAAAATMQAWNLAAEDIKNKFGVDVQGANEALVDFWTSKLPQAAEMGVNQQRQVQVHLREANSALMGEQLHEEMQTVAERVNAEKAGSQQRIDILTEEQAKFISLGLDKTADYQRVLELLAVATRQHTEKQKQIELEAAKTSTDAALAGTQERVAAAERELAVAKRLYGEDSTEYEAALRTKLTAEREYHRQVLEMKQLEVESSVAHAESELRVKEIQLQSLQAVGLISNKEELKQLEHFHEEEYKLEKAALEKRLQLLANDPTATPLARQKILDQLKALDDKYQVTQAQDEAKHLQERLQKVNQFLTSIRQNFQTSINGWLQGTQTFSQAMQHVWQGIAEGAIDSILQIGLQWIQEHVIMKAIAAIFHIDTTSMQTAADAEKVASGTLSNEALVFSDAALGAAAAWASIAAIPIYGPFLAPEVAAATYSGISALAPEAAFSQGGVVPRDMLAQVHTEEMVLDPPLSRGIKDLVKSGKNGGGDNHIHLHSTTQVTSMDGIDTERVLLKSGDIVGKIAIQQIKVAMKNGAFSS